MYDPDGGPSGAELQRGYSRDYDAYDPEPFSVEDDDEEDDGPIIITAGEN